MVVIVGNRAHFRAVLPVTLALMGFDGATEFVLASCGIWWLSTKLEKDDLKPLPGEAKLLTDWHPEMTRSSEMVK